MTGNELGVNRGRVGGFVRVLLRAGSEVPEGNGASFVMSVKALKER